MTTSKEEKEGHDHKTGREVGNQRGLSASLSNEGKKLIIREGRGEVSRETLVSRGGEQVTQAIFNSRGEKS